MIPRISQEMVDEVGRYLVSLTWEHGDRGVMILFYAGDETADASWREPGKYYGEGGVEFKLEDGPPPEVRERIEAICGKRAAT